jgi:hypothetical protein
MDANRKGRKAEMKVMQDKTEAHQEQMATMLEAKTQSSQERTPG